MTNDDDKFTYAERIAEFSGGWLDREMTQRLADLIKAVRVTGKGGSLTLTLNVTPRNAKDTDIVIIKPVMKDTMPKIAVSPEAFHTFGDGDLEPIQEEDDGLGDDDKKKESRTSKVTPIRSKA